MAEDSETGGFSLQREAGWRAGQYRQAARRLLVGLAYIALTALSLRSGLATPNPGILLPEPALLPALALLVGVVFLLQAGYGVLQTRKAPQAIRVLATAPPTLQWQSENENEEAWEMVVAGAGATHMAQAVVVSERWHRGRNAEVSQGALHIWPGGAELVDLLKVGKQRPSAEGGTDLQRTGQQLAAALALPYHYLTQPARVGEERLRQTALQTDAPPADEADSTMPPYPDPPEPAADV